MQANSDRSDQTREYPGLPLSADPWEARGGSSWVVGGLCTLALAVAVYLKIDPAAARARTEAGYKEQPAAPSERATARPEEPAPPHAEVEVDDHAGPAKTAAAGQGDTTAPNAGEQNPKPVRKAKRASAALQRLRRDLTIAANLGSPAAQETTTTVESPALPALSGHAEAALDEVPAIAPPRAPARTPAIPDNPY